MATEHRHPILNPVLKFTKDPRPKDVTARGKTVKSIVAGRLEKQRSKLATEFRELSELSSDQPSFGGRTVVYASMFEDSLAPTWTPKDLFSASRGARLMAPFRSGYLIEIPKADLESFANISEKSSNIKDCVDISRVEGIRFFDEEDASGSFSLDEAWDIAPQFHDGRGFLVWLMPLSSNDASEALLEVINNLRTQRVTISPTTTPQLELDLSGAPPSLSRGLRAISSADRMNSALRDYRQKHHASTTIIVPNRDSLRTLVSSGAVFRLEPIRPITSTSPGEGTEPERPLPADIASMPIVGIIDGGLNANSYRAAQAWQAPSFIEDAIADTAHGNKIVSLVVQGHSWNNNLKLPALYCQVGTVQAVPKRGSGVILDQEQFCQYLDTVMETYSFTKVWNFSFNEPASCDLEMVSFLGHQIALLARKHKVLPIISVGNRPGNMLQAPADCEAAITVGGRTHNNDGAPDEACPVSLPGPGPAGMLKPDISWFSHVRVLGGVETRGSSYSTALVSPLAAHTMERLREPSPDLAKALILHNASQGHYNRSTGFGSPSPTLPWETPRGSVTLQWSVKLKPGAAYYWEIPIPLTLKKTGKLKGNAKLTAILNPHPLASDYAGPNYFGARIEAALQCQRKDKYHNLLGSVDVGKLTEEEARKFDNKWCPVRHHCKTLNGISYTGDNLRIYARCYTRDLYIHGYDNNSEVPELSVVFVLSLEGDPADDIYTQLRNDLGSFVEIATVDVDIDLDLDSE
ncbi:S8 family peptidase [Gluconobacter frateurii]|uniref:S8 family peptidase n=1 Tax=Gluconobacter frateurii TaxID=38308 RepID=UPI001F058BB3|nr:S8 family peptidase [Gluconobacter frateurii]UMM07956.1 S8 family peptidase [Gluconobacter frateurii]